MMKAILKGVFLILLFLAVSSPAYAEVNQILRGVGKTLFSTVEIPKSMIEQSKTTIFPVGLLTGAVQGTYRTVVGTVNGVVDIAAGAAPYAKYLIFFV